MDKKLSIGKNIEIPVMILVYSLIGALAITGITMYVVQRSRSGEPMLPAGEDIKSAVKRQTRKLRREVEERRRLNAIDDDIENPVYPL